MLELRRRVFPRTLHIGQEMFGIHLDGSHYFYDDLKSKMNTGAIKKDEIIAIGFNNEELSVADRGDGTTGCGFCVCPIASIYSKLWADDDIEFDSNKLPYITSESEALTTQIGGKHNTELIQEISEEIEIYSPAVKICLSQSINIGNVKRTAFLPSYAQLYYLSKNYNALNAFYSLLGQTAPKITSGRWWTSCQYSSAFAVTLYNGSLGYYFKSFRANVLLCFDI